MVRLIKMTGSKPASTMHNAPGALCSQSFHRRRNDKRALPSVSKLNGRKINVAGNSFMRINEHDERGGQRAAFYQRQMKTAQRLQRCHNPKCAPPYPPSNGTWAKLDSTAPMDTAIKRITHAKIMAKVEPLNINPVEMPNCARKKASIALSKCRQRHQHADRQHRAGHGVTQRVVMRDTAAATRRRGMQASGGNRPTRRRTYILMTADAATATDKLLKARRRTLNRAP